MSLETKRRTIGASSNKALLRGMAAKNNGRYNGNGREWETPPELFNQLDAEFFFDLDPCASHTNAKCGRYFTEEDDGLRQPWVNDYHDQPRVFMNPPYGREVAAWTRKAREEVARGALVVGLLPASTDLAWWHEDVVGHAEVRYIRGRVRFLTGGPYRASGFFASVIVIWRPQMKTPEEWVRRSSFIPHSIRFNNIVDAVEARCMAADGPVTPTLQEISEKELAALWRSVRGMRKALDEALNEQGVSL